jgi:hypothetical protein
MVIAASAATPDAALFQVSDGALKFLLLGIAGAAVAHEYLGHKASWEKRHPAPRPGAGITQQR